MESKMKRTAISVLLAAMILVVSSAQVLDRFEYKIPRGWAFKKAEFSKSGMKAVLLAADVPYEGEVASQTIPSRLLVFDGNNAILDDIPYSEPKQIKMTQDESIILSGGIEETDHITVLDSHGRHLFDLSTKGRGPYPALLGKEIGLARREPGGTNAIVGSVSIIDGRTGREKISIGPPSGKGIAGYSGFLPIGEEGKFVISTGATVCMRTYLNPGRAIWRIDNIGGNVREIMPISEDCIGVAYNQNEFGSNWIMAGAVIIDHSSGRILFRQESKNPNAGLWKFLHGGFDIYIEGEDLIFSFADCGEQIRLPRNLGSSMLWDLNRAKHSVATNKAKNEEITADSRHVIKSNKGLLVIENIRYWDKVN
jgi:hypothetical protein